MNKQINKHQYAAAVKQIYNIPKITKKSVTISNKEPIIIKEPKIDTTVANATINNINQLQNNINSQLTETFKKIKEMEYLLHKVYFNNFVILVERKFLGKK